MSTKMAMEQMCYSHTVRCKCGEHYEWPGKPLDATYLCRHCRKPMKVETIKHMTQDEAKFALQGRHFEDECVCGNKCNHRLKQWEDAVFLVCGICGDEIREVEPKEIS